MTSTLPGDQLLGSGAGMGLDRADRRVAADAAFIDTAPLCAGVDEAGRGPLAGPVVAAAVVLDPARPIEGLADSKRLSPRRRAALFDLIRARALAWGVGMAEPEEIDAINILQATFRAMQRAVSDLGMVPAEILVDGNRTPAFPVPARAIIGGDATIACISAASILAKETRDRLMLGQAARYPAYGFEVHKGYPTAAHRAILRELGPTPIHRQSFRPVREAREAREERVVRAAGDVCSPISINESDEGVAPREE